MKLFDVVIVGAGAAGLFCAGVAAQQGLQVLVLDHSEKVAEKIRISGGGRSNFTNRELDVRAPHKHFLGDNPQFCRSALSRYTPQDFVALMQKHNIPFHEKHKGQLFCDRSAEDLIQMLLAECNGSANGGSVTRWQPCSLKAMRYSDAAPEAQRYEVDTSQGTVHAFAVVVATGGLSIPKIGATDIGYRLAKQFNLRVVEPRPGLVPLVAEIRAFGEIGNPADAAFHRDEHRDPEADLVLIDQRHAAQDDAFLEVHVDRMIPAALQLHVPDFIRRFLLDRAAVGRAGGLDQADLRLDAGIVAGAAGIGAGLSVARNRTVHEARIQLAQGVVVDAQRFRD